MTLGKEDDPLVKHQQNVPFIIEIGSEETDKEAQRKCSDVTLGKEVVGGRPRTDDKEEDKKVEIQTLMLTHEKEKGLKELQGEKLCGVLVQERRCTVDEHDKKLDEDIVNCLGLENNLVEVGVVSVYVIQKQVLGL
jgi:hypothetical protein